jgi:isoquinoline 1-oxidoreductase alpha subunit
MTPAMNAHGGDNLMVQFVVNGTRVDTEADAGMPLLWFLRDELGLTGTKFGCGAGLCGACTIHLNRTAVRGCQTTVGDAAGATVTTIEGLSTNGMHPVQLAWRTLNVPQCGYCQAGQIMQAASLLKDTPSPTDQQINDAMYGNLCRCGTYPRIRAAVKQAAENMKSMRKGASL